MITFPYVFCLFLLTYPRTFSQQSPTACKTHGSSLKGVCRDIGKHKQEDRIRETLFYPCSMGRISHTHTHPKPSNAVRNDPPYATFPTEGHGSFFLFIRLKTFRSIATETTGRRHVKVGPLTRVRKKLWEGARHTPVAKL
ncbi:uncharacterized protein TEOVI_000425500 [Trypanosoma equiperdum]|uniref:Secreted protein n=1 Tax=Trypanosoma equiperdum TaxID=5694 RepID=A0A1G4IJH0_TRYEQ|nr:hypothetical protein, conserved [Trypanosoma equiperdum]